MTEISEVALISPLTTTKWRLPSLGLLYVASYLEKHGVSVKAIDPLSQGKEDYTSHSEYTGITCMSNQFKKAEQIAKEVKERNPETITVLGGVHPTVSTEEVRSNPHVDVVVVGEGETAMLKIVKEKITEGVVYGEKVRNLDDIPFPARHLINMDWYLERDGTVVSEWLRATSVLTSRGCPFECNFCINSKRAMFGKRIRYHSSKYVEGEVQKLVSKYRLEGIFFADDNFTTHRERLAEICKGIKRFNLKWNCVSRVDTINKRTLTTMKESGCVSVGFGVESGSQRVLNALNKDASISDTIKAFDLCREVGVKTWAFIIIGSPEETREDIELTEKLLNRIRADFVGVSFLTPYPGTLLYDMASEKGWAIRDDATWSTDEPQMKVNFSLEQLEEIGKYLMEKYNSRLRRLKNFSKNPYFIYDVLRLFGKNPTLLFKWIKP